MKPKLWLGITGKLASVYLIVAIPLVIIIAATYIGWFNSRTDRVMQERTRLAQLASTTFTLLISDIAKSLKFTGHLNSMNGNKAVNANAILGELLEDYPIDFVLYTDSTGTVIASTDNYLLRKNLAVLPTFSKIIHGKEQLAIGNSEIVQGKVGFYVAQAIRARSKNLDGIVGAFIDVGKLGQTMPIKIEQGGINIVDSSGRIIFQNEYPGLAQDRANWGKFDFIKAALAGKSIQSKFTFPPTGKTRFVSEVPIKAFGWAAGSGIDEEDGTGPILKDTIKSTVLTTIVLVVAMMLSILISRRIIKSLDSLVDKAKAIGEGRLNETVILKTGDEIEDVANSLDNARENIKHLLEQIKNEQKQVESFAQELEMERDALQTIMENTKAQIAYLDYDFNFVMVNVAYAEGSGYTKVELIGRNHFELFPNKENEELFGTARQTKSAIEFRAKPFIFEDQPWRGTTYWDWTLTPVINNAGNVIGLVLSLIDMTEAIRSKKLSDALNIIGDRISSTFDFSKIMKTAIVTAGEAIGCDAAAVLMRDDGDWIFKFTYGYPENFKGLRLTADQVKNTLVSGNPKEFLMINDVNEDAQINQGIVNRLGIHALLSVPVALKDDVIGSLVLICRHKPFTFAEDHADFAIKLGYSLSLALTNSRLYEAEHRIADTLQGALLAIPEHIRNIDFGYLYRSATEVAKVGGDFYDIFEIEHNKVAVLIGDVSGKGIEAAALTSVVRNVIKAYAYEECSPALIMGKTNKAVYKNSPESSFVSVFLAILDTETGAFEYCSAGHPQAMIKRNNNEIELLRSDSPVIAAFSELTYIDSKANLKIGDTIILYTDGIIEARNERREFFDQDMLISSLKNLSPMPAKSMPQAIFNQVMSFSEGKLSDDVAILCISYSKLEST